MERTRQEYIKELIQVAQENIWRNELYLKYYSDDKVKADSAKEHIKRDSEYIENLKKEL
jgi:hypothetical protein